MELKVLTSGLDLLSVHFASVWRGLLMTKKLDDQGKSKAVQTKRTYLKQSDVPAASLEDALRVPQAILEHYAGKPTPPLHVAKALNVDPKGSQLKVLTGAAIAFDLIQGGAQAATISVTDLAKRILRPKAEGADTAAKREAVLKPRVFAEFLTTYDGNAFPRQDIALNVLEDKGVVTTFHDTRKTAGSMCFGLKCKTLGHGYPRIADI